MKRLLLIFYLLIFCLSAYAQPGCTDVLATNYSAGATINDGSCLYPAGSITPVTSVTLDNNLSETSGLIKWNSSLWTHNDNTDINLYALDTTTGSIIQSYALTGLSNVDWEEISQDSDYVYVGDFGNNVNGNRTDLKIFRIEKNSLLAQAPVIDTIFFSYSDQTDFTSTGNNNTDFDCEAFAVTADSIYLFTKQWVSTETSLYSLSKTPGTHVANFKATLDVQGLITAAVLMEEERLIALSGYSTLLQPFAFLLYDYGSTDFFSGNKRKLSVSLPFHQMEGITTSDGLTFYMTNEYFSIVATPQKLHVFDMNQYLSNYLNGLWQSSETDVIKQHYFFPNPFSNHLTFSAQHGEFTEIRIYDISGKTVLTSSDTAINTEDLSTGLYFFEVISKDPFISRGKIIRQ